MSPEQASGKSHLVDHRTDIYSLGVTLYEMATLRPLFSDKDRDCLLQRVRADDPPPPRQFAPLLPVDLETIILKALAKSRGQRYETARDLADDLRRFLDGHPIAARRPTLRDRLTKWGTRHKRAVTVAFGLLCATAAISSFAAIFIAKAHTTTTAALARSEENYRQAREVVDHFGVLLVERLSNTPGNETVCRELLDETLRYYATFIEQSHRDPSLQTDLAFAHFKSGEIQEQLGMQHDALHSYRQARALLERSLALRDSSQHDSAHAALARCLNNLAGAVAKAGDSDAAMKLYAHAISHYESLRQQQPTVVAHARHLAMAQSNLGLLHARLGHDADAAQNYQQASELQRQLVALQPDEATLRYDLAMTLNNRSHLLRATDRDAALSLCRAAVQLLEASPDTSNQSINGERPQTNLAVTLNNLAILLASTDELTAARSACERAIAIYQRQVEKSPTLPTPRRDLAVSYNNLGRLLGQSHDLSAAHAAYLEGEKILRSLVAEFPESIEFRGSLGGVLNNRGLIATKQQRADEAHDCFRQAVEHLRCAMQQAPHVVEYREFLQKSSDNLQRSQLTTQSARASTSHIEERMP